MIRSLKEKIKVFNVKPLQLHWHLWGEAHPQQTWFHEAGGRGGEDVQNQWSYPAVQ